MEVEELEAGEFSLLAEELDRLDDLDGTEAELALFPPRRLPWPFATACLDTAVLMLPVPPINKIFMS